MPLAVVAAPKEVTLGQSAIASPPWQTLLMAYVVARTPDAQKALDSKATELLLRIQQFVRSPRTTDGWKEALQALFVELSHTQCTGWSNVGTWDLGDGSPLVPGYGGKALACEVGMEALSLGHIHSVPGLVNFGKVLLGPVDGRRSSAPAAAGSPSS